MVSSLQSRGGVGCGWEGLTRAVTAVGVRDHRIYSVAALVLDRKLWD